MALQRPAHCSRIPPPSHLREPVFMPAKQTPSLRNMALAGHGRSWRRAAAGGSARCRPPADAVYWTESRPEEGGRQAILRAVEGAARSRSCCRLPSRPARACTSTAAVSSWSSAARSTSSTTRTSRSTRSSAGRRRHAGSPTSPRMRFADFADDAPRPADRGRRDAPRTKAGSRAPRNLAGRDRAGRRARAASAELVAGRDFYASPRLSPDGRRLAFLAWDLPDMPWDSATLYVANVRHGRQARPAARASPAAMAAPSSSPSGARDGSLYFVWDETGWGQLYRWRNGRIDARARRRAAQSSCARSGCSAHAAMRSIPTAGSAWSPCRAALPRFEVRDREARQGARAYAALAGTGGAHRRSRRARRRLCRARQPARRGARRHAHRRQAARAALVPAADRRDRPAAPQQGRDAASSAVPTGRSRSASTTRPGTPRYRGPPERRRRLSCWPTAAPPP